MEFFIGLSWSKMFLNFWIVYLVIGFLLWFLVYERFIVILWCLSCWFFVSVLNFGVGLVYIFVGGLFSGCIWIYRGIIVFGRVWCCLLFNRVVVVKEVVYLCVIYMRCFDCLIMFMMNKWLMVLGKREVDCFLWVYGVWCKVVYWW